MIKQNHDESTSTLMSIRHLHCRKVEVKGSRYHLQRRLQERDRTSGSGTAKETQRESPLMQAARGMLRFLPTIEWREAILCGQFVGLLKWGLLWIIYHHLIWEELWLLYNKGWGCPSTAAGWWNGGRFGVPNVCPAQWRRQCPPQMLEVPRCTRIRGSLNPRVFGQ